MKYLILIILALSSQLAGAISVLPSNLNFANIGGLPAPASAWSFTNTAGQATVTGSLFLSESNNMHGDFDFRLGEKVNYSITSLSLALLNEEGRLFTEILLADSVILPSTGRPPAYSESVTALSPLAAIYLSDSGTLDPGRYTFHYASALVDGIAAFGFNFTMTSVPEAISVPDTGSSLLLMSLGLGAIVFVRRARGRNEL